MKSILTSMRRSHSRLMSLALVGTLTVAMPLLAADDEKKKEAADPHAAHESSAPPAKLVEVVRNATKQYVDVNVATASGYGAFLGCISGPDQGAMGVHYVNGDLVGDGQVDATKPEALIYEPQTDGTMKLVGVEFIVDAATWLATHKAAPVLEGQVFLYNNAPNRYGLPAFFELHVWAWRDNPNGSFVDWNPRVTCENK